MAATFVYDVLLDMIHPVVAREGDVLVVRVGSDEPVAVVKRGTTTPLRVGPPNYGALLGLLEAGVIRERSAAGRRALTG